MEVHVARQPIFTVPSGPVGPLDRAAEVLAGYELLFRDGPNNAFPDVDGDVATSKVLHHSFFAHDFDELVGHTLGFVNFTRELLVKRMPKMFPARRLVVEILETVTPDAEVVEACKELKRLGYHLVLDDFVMAPGMDALLDLAWMVKFDVRSTPVHAIASMIEKFKNRDMQFLAEKVETRTELAALRDVGCTWFQGYFFAKPEMVTRTDVAPAKMVLLKLMHEVVRPEQDLQALERLIAADVSMSYKLMRYINSAYFGRPQKIESIRQALVLLGEREVRQLVMLVATARLATRKPNELLRLSVMRARMAETLAAKIPGASREELFVVGLFSSIDAIMDRPMAALVNQLPLSMEVKRALVDRLGTLGAVLNLVLAYERADWAEVARLVTAFKLDGKDLPLAHQLALRAGEAFLDGED